MDLYRLDGVALRTRSVMAALPDGGFFSRVLEAGRGTFAGDGAPASRCIDERAF